jgi:hypothetical protein
MLFDGAGEHVTIEDWQPGAKVMVANPDGIELLVVAGGLHDGGDRLEPWSWLRLPAGQALSATVGPDGARLWIKRGPLLHADACAFDAPIDASGR